MGITESKHNKTIEDLKAQIGLLHSSDRDREIQELREQLNDLKSIDKNRDSIITKKEIDDWVKIQTAEINEFKKKIKEDLEKERKVENEAKYVEMQRQIESLKAINRELENKLAGKTSQKIDHDSSNLSKRVEISQEKIDSYVESLLSDKNVNIKYLPDFVERQLYRNMINVLMGLVQNMADSTEIKFMGHKFLVNMSPDEQIDLSLLSSNTLNAKTGASEEVYSRTGSDDSIVSLID
ncbi:hypothetical protein YASMINEVIRUS_1530 [Yasminevirus sp. GU-2018]|uniref:Uncharacterized protein n=1 Tax=Yasminevirus sp. GU-2018 TaxID=2420051 RepID=A0A5K0UAF2_9VIRU|nr:hypothetical protein YASMINEVIRUS_1530 [Yasminevirus sp. GU-2018]